MLLSVCHSARAQTPAADTVIIPEAVKVSREREVPLPLIERQFMLSSLSEGSMETIFEAPPCLEGEYYIGFQLYYDLGDRQTLQDWTSSLGFAFMHEDDTLWQNSLQVSMATQTFIATTFHDVPVSCDADYRFYIKTKTVSGAVPQDNIYLKVLLYKRLEDVFDPAASLQLNYAYAGDEVTASWTYAGESALAYDVEWVFIDDHDNFSGTAQQAFAFKRPVRITTAALHYTHQVYYPSGRLWYRVRAVGYTPQYPDHRIPGHWFYGSGAPVAIVNHQPGKNWQVQTAYAEEGKYKKVMNYLDGTFRQRQVLTNLSTEELVLVGETLYDYEGRQSAEVLAVPSADATLAYKSGFHIFQAVDTEVATRTSAIRQKFHYDNYRLEGSVLTDQAGAGKYYSPANDIAGIHAGYIPDGEGYVYSQVEYMRDGTVRTTRQSGVGEAFRIDGPHAMRHHYGNAAPAELIRLFGSNAGEASHYKKNLVVDANGQVNVSYADQGGRLVASALAGDKPANVDALESYAALGTGPLTVDISNNNRLEDGVSHTGHKVMNVNPNTNYTFRYDLSSYGATVGPLGCQTCTFDLIITLADPEGSLLDLSSAPGNESSGGYRYERRNITAADCANPVANVVEFTVMLTDIGDYTITKTLIPYEQSFDDLQNLVFQDVTILQKIQDIYDSYEIDSAACEICTSCPEADTAIEEAIRETTDRDCENIYQQIVQHYREQYGSATEDPYEVPQDSIEAHPLYCQYELCVKDKQSEVFEKQLARVADWAAASGQGYTDPANTDPFFNNSSLSGWGYKSSLQSKLNDVLVGTIAYDNNDDGVQDGTTTYRGTIGQVTDPANTAYYVDENGNPDAVNGRHILYLDLVGRRSQMTTAAYQAALSRQRWTLYKSFYLEAKRKTKLEIPAYQDCAAAREELERTDELPQTPEDIADWGDDNGATGPVSAAELEMVVSNLAFNCNTQFSAADSASIAGHLEAYFNDNPRNLFRLILRADVGTDAHLVAIQNILNSYNCSLNTVSLDDPISCVEEQANRIVNPLLNTGSANCPSDITSSCYPGWAVATGTPNTDLGGGTGRVFIWAYPFNNTSEAIRGSFTSPLEAGTKYELCFKYKVEQDNDTYTSGRMDNVYMQLSRSREFLNANGATVTTQAAAALMRSATDSLALSRGGARQALANCLLPGAKYPDPVMLGDQTVAVDKVWAGSSITNVSAYRDTCVVFVPTEASTYFYLSVMSCTAGTYQGVNIKDLVLRKIPPRDHTIEFEGETVCVNYDTANATLKGFSFKVDWSREVARCLDNAAQENTQLIDYAVEKLIEEEITTIYNTYNTQCLSAVTEKLTYTYLPKEYHYTLYYYDQAGNLVQTVPPQGVKPLTPQQVDAFLAGNRTEPAHTLTTKYHYNSINQLIDQQSPDGGQSRFWYNGQGQLKLSQNARQQQEDRYSYTRYDEQGRIVETGEMETAVPLPALLTALESPHFPEAQTYSLSDITRTHYDIAYDKPLDLTQENLRTRVSYVEVMEKGSADTIATYYSYDIHGNVKALLQYIPGLPAKRIDYQYDLLSGNVNYVFYQYKKPDQFVHRYEYDADNRITEVYTSTDRFIWNREASYQYYLHGPVARMELGAYRVQAMDYYYTLQGWIKGVNMPYTGDPGGDGVNGSAVGKDVFAYALGYYNGDYSPVGAAVPLSDSRDQLWPRLQETMNHAGLFNGNISWMVTDLSAIGELNNERERGMQAMLYRYDQLHRIVKSRSLTDYSASTGFAARASANAAYDTDYSYDANGNLLTLQRRDDTGALMDDFHYQYYRGTNRLKEVNPVVRDTVYASGPIVTNHKVYRNITIENTAHVEAFSHVRLNASENIFMSPEFRAHEDADFYAHILDEDEGTFMYDAIGNLVADQDKGIRISWTPYGKVREVRSKIDSVVVSFRYDGAGNRVEKKVVKPDTVYVIRYVHASKGDVMTVCFDTTVTEHHIYGTMRLGMHKGEKKEGTLLLGKRNYELSNHLGNVLAVITDQAGMDQDSVWATVVGSNDYYPFGAVMPERVHNDTLYRYGFQGQEKEQNGEFGSQTNYSYKFRIYDPSIGRFLSIDPLTKNYPFYSPYTFSGNRVIDAVEMEGLEPVNLTTGARIDFGAQTELQLLKSNDYSLWRDMLQWEKSSQYRKVFNQADRGRILDEQEMDWAFGDDLNTDYYAVNITQLPKGMSQAGLYDHIRKNIGSFMDPDIATFSPHTDFTSDDLWNSPNPTGAIMTFHNFMDDAAVLTTQAGGNHWVFTPVGTAWDWEHPLAGHRQFGLSDNEDGSFTFYTRGVDMMWDFEDWVYNETQEGGRFFNQADRLWNYVMDSVVDYINSNGGAAQKTHNFNRRIDWDKDVNDDDK